MHKAGVFSHSVLHEAVARNINFLHHNPAAEAKFLDAFMAGAT